MAILKSLGLSVTVNINGVAAVEYDNPDPNPDKKYPDVPCVSKYIESKDNTEYSISCQALPQHTWLSKGKKNILRFIVRADGEHEQGTIYSSSDQTRQAPVEIQGVVNRDFIRKFKFSAIQTVDAADARSVRRDLERATELGVIRVRVYRCLDQGDAFPGNKSHNAGDKSHNAIDFTIAEKALKGRAVSHGTALSAPKACRPSRWVKTAYVDRNPYAVFEFKYRSRDALRSELIVPRTPSPEPADEGIEGLSQDDIRRLARERLQDLKKETKPKRPVKREHDEVFNLTEDSEDDSKPLQKILRKRKGPPEIIDLTDD